MLPSTCSYRIAQGTLAKSGTSEFLAKAEGQASDGTASGNLIGAFGLGFYSSFLVADRVTVASIPPKSENVPEPVQYVFSSSADDASFEIFPDPRGNTLGRGTEVTLYLKPDAVEYLEEEKIIELVYVYKSLFRGRLPEHCLEISIHLFLLPSLYTSSRLGLKRYQMRKLSKKKTILKQLPLRLTRKKPPSMRMKQSLRKSLKKVRPRRQNQLR